MTTHLSYFLYSTFVPDVIINFNYFKPRYMAKIAAQQHNYKLTFIVKLFAVNVVSNI